MPQRFELGLEGCVERVLDVEPASLFRPLPSSDTTWVKSAACFA